jgi:uncharacterized Tic20 family protein
MSFYFIMFLAPYAVWRAARNGHNAIGPQTNETCDAFFKAVVWGVVAIYAVLITWKNWRNY